VSDKQKLQELIEQLSQTMSEINKIADQHPSIMVYYDYDKEGKLQMGESFSAVCETFEGRLGYLQKQLRKVVERLPSQRGRKKKC